VKLVVQELTIATPTEVVYRLLTEPAQFVRWMAEDATLDLRSGSPCRRSGSGAGPGCSTKRWSSRAGS
jgi:uncharacterized protein YndB with AHSA1/START domain